MYRRSSWSLKGRWVGYLLLFVSLLPIHVYCIRFVVPAAAAAAAASTIASVGVEGDRGTQQRCRARLGFLSVAILCLFLARTSSSPRVRSSVSLVFYARSHLHPTAHCLACSPALARSTCNSLMLRFPSNPAVRASRCPRLPFACRLPRKGLLNEST